MDEVASLFELEKFFENEDYISFLTEFYVFDYSKVCIKCGEEGTIHKSNQFPDDVCFWCKKCRRRWTIRQSTIFNNMKISLKQFFLCMFMFLFNYPNQIVSYLLFC